MKSESVFLNRVKRGLPIFVLRRWNVGKGKESEGKKKKGEKKMLLIKC